MRKLDLNFAIQRTLVQKIGVVSFILAISACIYCGYIYFALVGEISDLEAQWQKANRSQNLRSKAVPISRGDLEQMQIRFKTANLVIERLNLRWNDLFQALEASVDDQVTLLSVEPDTEKEEVKISAEAKDFPAMLEYEKRLQTTPLFQEPYIASHEIQQQDPQKPIRFVILMQWLIKKNKENS